MSEGHRTPALTGAQIGHILQAMVDSFGQQLRSPIPRAPGTVAVGVVLHRQRLRSDLIPDQVHDDVLTEPSDVQTMFDNIPVADKKLQWIHGTTRRWDGYLEFQRHPGPMLEWFAKRPHDCCPTTPRLDDGITGHFGGLRLVSAYPGRQ
jgi:hypothetical protein